MKRLKNNCGETLVETLVSILFIALSGVMLLTAALSANRVNRAAVKMDTDLRDGQEAAERQTAETESGEVTVTVGGVSVKYEVSVFYLDDDTGNTEGRLCTYVLK